jgi:hypothetical protein
VAPPPRWGRRKIGDGILRFSSQPASVPAPEVEAVFDRGEAAEGKGAGLVLPSCNSEAMALHLEEISLAVAPGVHAILLLDPGGMACLEEAFHPRQHHVLPLPPKSPELNPVENIWQFMRDNWLSNRIFKSHDDIIDHCCFAWNKLIDMPWKIMSIGTRDWVYRS